MIKNTFSLFFVLFKASVLFLDMIENIPFASTNMFEKKKSGTKKNEVLGFSVGKFSFYQLE